VGPSSTRAGPPDLDVDVALLSGFRFRCRPDCGLCCFAEARVDPPERTRLLQIAPEVRFVGRGSDQFLASNPDGGSCQFLADHRCRVHGARPHPCREFPVTVHVGHRLQASLVLSCPGLDLDPLRPADRAADVPCEGLEDEIASVRTRLGPLVARRLAAAQVRGKRIERTLRSEGRWIEEGEVRRRLRDRLPRPGDANFPVEDPPEISEARESLPLFYDGRSGPLALARELGGWAVLELSPAGGGETLGVIPPPDRPPALRPESGTLLDAYLRYVLDRDQFLAAVELDALEGGTGDVAEWARSELATLGAVVVARGSVRAKLHGRDGRTLSEDDVIAGIRATDMDWLDRPTWGDRL